MQPITNNEITTLRNETNTIFTTDCVISKSGEVIADNGTRKRADTYVNTKCYIVPLTKTAFLYKSVEDRLLGSEGWLFSVPYNTEVEITDKIIFNEKTYQIIGIQANVPTIYKRLIARLEE